MPTLLVVPTECPKCGAQGLWDNRTTKKNPKAPDFKCKDKACDGVVWSPKPGQVWADMAVPAPVAAPQHFTAGPHIPALDGPALTHGALVTEKLSELMSSYDLCFSHAVGLASKVEKVGTVVTLEGVSAIAATLFIAAKERGLA